MNTIKRIAGFIDRGLTTVEKGFDMTDEFLDAGIYIGTGVKEDAMSDLASSRQGGKD